MNSEYKRKPDPDEPWRYVCPECGRQVFGRASVLGYRCLNGHGLYDKSELVDRKQSRPSEQ